MKALSAFIISLCFLLGLSNSAKADYYGKCQSPYGGYSYFCYQTYAQYDQVTCRYPFPNGTYYEHTYIKVAYETYSCVDMTTGYYYECNINYADPVCGDIVDTE